MENTQEKRKKTIVLGLRESKKEVKKFINNNGITIDIVDESRIGNQVTYTYIPSGKNMFDKKNAKKGGN